MAKRIDQVVVVDVESTCWAGDPPAGQESEIIEIGVCALDIASGMPGAPQAILVRPERSTVGEFCTGLTTLTQDEVSAGLPFSDACRLLHRTYLTKDRLWASWGDYDRRQFERQCRGRGVGYPFGPGHLNVKTLFATVFALPREVGMDAAHLQVGLPLQGTHHRGVDDAANIARLLSVLMLRARGGPGAGPARDQTADPTCQPAGDCPRTARARATRAIEPSAAMGSSARTRSRSASRSPRVRDVT